MAWVRPRFLVFADPIFHFGPSNYAAEFRRKLRESCARHDYTIIVPMRYYGLLTDAMPELRGRTIGIPSDKPNGFNLDLASEFRVFTTANILTYLMLPVASTLARRVYLLGCDGRPLDESGYFWSHNKKTQINDQMDNIRLVHPGFFAIDYNDYYLDHCRQLEELIGEGEKMGREYGTVTPSFIPALQTRPANLPRMLVIDFTEIGAHNATGQLKAALFKSWPAEKVLQVRPLSTRDGSFFRLHSQAEHPAFKQAKLTREDVLREAADFDPQLIYFRPTDSPPEFLELGWEIVQRLDVPVVSHIMDDWPERLRVENPERFARIDPTLRALLARSAVRLSIGDAMSAAFRERYGCDFVAVANGIEPTEWTALESAAKSDGAFVIRYCGGLTDDMTTASVEAFARVVGELSAELPVRFEIYALPAALKTAQERFRDFSAVTVLPSVPWTDYPRLLATANALLIAYNFDERTRTYTQYSMANKLPECLASGVPLLVFGPETIATVRRARELGAAVLVTSDDAQELKAAVRRLALEPETFRESAARARTRALAELSVESERRKFQAAVLHLDRARPSRIESRTLLGPYTRLQRRRVDACTVAAQFFSAAASAKVALALGDVGNDCLEKFVEREWTVISCPELSDAERHVASLAPTFGKNAVAVVLCSARDYARLRPLPIRTVATLVFHEGGANAVRMTPPAFPEARMVWSESYPAIAEGAAPDFRVLREICSPAELPSDRSGVVMVIDPSVLKIRKGAGDAVVQIRKAYTAALDDAAAEAAGASGEQTVSRRILGCMRAWGAAIQRLNVRFQVSRFFRERFAEAWEIVQPSRRGRLIVWK
jgi:glycosyltransferase involved in cell wall biosynthesis